MLSLSVGGFVPRQRPNPALMPAPSLWRDALFGLAHQPAPLFVFEDVPTPAASIWTGSRLYVDAFREAGLEPGDRLVLALPPSAAWYQALVGAIWQGLTIAFVPPTADLDAALEQLDARAAIAPDPHAHAWTPDEVSGPLGTPRLRAAAHAPTPEARFLLRTSGTSGAPTWVALSDANIWATLRSHRPALGYDGARVLSVLPWHHAFGLILEALPALLDASELTRDPHSGRDPDALVALAQEAQSTHLSAVPLTVRRLASASGGRELLARLDGGIVGGAPLAQDVADALAGTNLRVGYGQTEASPGIALGEPGAFAPNTLGRPLGCDVRLGARGEIEFRGANAALGVWSPEASGARFARLDPDRWVPTGDLAALQTGGTLSYRGRAGDTFKLANGRFVRAGDVEATLRQKPGVLDAVLGSPDGDALHLALLMDTDQAAPGRPALDAALGSLAPRLARVRTHSEADWPTLPKGTPLRARLLS